MQFHFLNNHGGVDANLFQRSQIIGMQVNKTSKETAKTTKTGKIVGNHHPQGRNLVMLWQKLNEMMSQQMGAINKAKGGPTKYYYYYIFWGDFEPNEIMCFLGIV